MVWQTEKIDLAHLLVQMQSSPTHKQAAAIAAGNKQDVNLALMFCSNLNDTIGRALRDNAKISNVLTMLTTSKGAKAAARWVIQTGTLGRYSLSSEWAIVRTLDPSVSPTPAEASYTLSWSEFGSSVVQEPFPRERLQSDGTCIAYRLID